jgi:hypothetical protein
MFVGFTSGRDYLFSACLEHWIHLRTLRKKEKKDMVRQSILVFIRNDLKLMLYYFLCWHIILSYQQGCDDHKALEF